MSDAVQLVLPTTSASTSKTEPPLTAKPRRPLTPKQKVSVVVCCVLLWICAIVALLAAFNVFEGESSLQNASSKSSNDIWTPIFKCVDTAAVDEDVQFYGLDLEDIQSLIIESDAHKVLISGLFDGDRIEFEYVNNEMNILSETLLRGLSISSLNYTPSDWDSRSKYFNIIHKEETCASNAYIPNIWFETCGNSEGLHIIRNGSDSLCTFKQSSAHIVSSTITIYIDAEPGLPIIDNKIEPTVFDNLNAMEAYTKSVFPDVSYISVNEYIASYINESDICLIDARTDAEYDISRMENSVNISWARIDGKILNETDVLDIISNECGRDLDRLRFVTYCTVGYRAGNMAMYLIDNLTVDPSNVYAVTQAIVSWADERRPMVNDDGSTTLVHTFDNSFGRSYVLPKYRYCC